ncbi:site-specific recombinase XerD [Actimicrobium sp. GrIS 1.19]|uniref:phage integrase family protein n=1 Tax=Actimicrobium sp. GrIS 1.19 TaxID=3071708 RepID=UPI002E07C691|nr:site-specific recombinase XerD [Actimicrobium sp. GrIS 1.19]
MRGGWVECGTVLIRLTRAHFAFYRGYLEGLDPGTLAQHYLENAAAVDEAVTDRRVARSTIGWIRAPLLVAARRVARPSMARLLALPPERLQQTDCGDVPALDAFRLERDPCEVYSEEELIALFTAQYGATSARATHQSRRNERLRKQQLAALRQLEGLIAVDPTLDDGVDGWLDPALAARLKAAGIHRLSELVEAINALGYRWYRKVPKAGEKAAAQIVRWLTDPGVSSALGIVLPTRALSPRRDLPQHPPAPLRTGIVPLENLLVPHALDGANGSNRGSRSLLSAHNDLAAIQAWLNQCKPGGHTQRSYRKEAERFVLWALVEQRKPVSSLTVEDCIAYRDFLWDLGRVTPAIWSQKFTVGQDRWLGARGTPRWSAWWRPFAGPLSAASQKTALVIIQSLCQWLTDQHYLHGNPFKAIGWLARRDDHIDVTRALTRAEWHAIRQHLAQMARDARYWRLRLILVLAYSSGARLSELVSLRRNQFTCFTREGNEEDGGHADRQWEVRITGKGDKVRVVQLPLCVIDELRRDFQRRGHVSFDAAPPDSPVIAALEVDAATQVADRPLSQSRLYDILKGFFAEVADGLPAARHQAAERIRRASTHWLRHTFATQFLHSGGDLAMLRDLLGHASLATTSVYVTTERDNRSRAMEKFAREAML